MAKRSDIIRQREGSPYWYENFTVDGHRFRGSTEETDEAKARLKAARTLADAKSGVLVKRGDVEFTLDQAAGVYLAESAGHRVSAHNIERALERALKHIGSQTPLSQLTTGQIAAWVAQRRGTIAPGKETFLSPSTVNREVAYLRAALYYAHEVYGAPMPDVKWRRLMQDEPDERETIISPDQQNKLFEKLRPDYWPLVGFALLTGQRLGNCRRLRWASVDFERKLIHFKIKSRKPGGRSHTIPMTDELAAILSVERGRHPDFVFTYEGRVNRCFGHRNARGDLVEVRHYRGQRYPFTVSGWRRSWLKALEDAGLDDVRFHDLRHTAATRVLAASGNIKIVQRLLGHADIKTTVRYLRANVDDVREAMLKVQALSRPAEAAKKA